MRVRYNMVCCYVVRPAAGHENVDAGEIEFLQIRRSADDFMGGTWQTVYGTSEENETAWAAAVRELKEETGLAARELYRLEPVDVFYIAPQDTLWHSVQFCAVVGRDDVVRLNDEHDASRWLPRKEAAAQFMWLANQAAVTAIVDLLRGSLAKPHARVLPARKP